MNLEPLPREVLDLLSHFNQLWERGRRPDIDDFLHSCPAAYRAKVLARLVECEIRHRRAVGEEARLDEYLTRYPELRELKGNADQKVESASDQESRHPTTRSRSPGDKPPPQDWFENVAQSTHGGTSTPPPPVGPPPDVFAITSERPAGYEILGVLGEGGMGVVYHAREPGSGRDVALKVMRHPTPAHLARFKQEFRSLQDLHHPNLISLYNVISDGRWWFFTMELVRGVDFLSYVRGPAYWEMDTASYPSRPPPSTESGTKGHTCPVNLTRLRAALRQLVGGVHALHTAGKLHRDLKPSNVLVTADGTVKLLDLGLAADLDPTGLHQSTSDHVVGTAAYMSPEQAEAGPISPASDWYSVGVMLYQALTGQLPFTSPFLLASRLGTPPSPKSLVPDLPDDLVDLCTDLLNRSPWDRPLGSEVLLRLGPADGDGSIGQAVAAPVSRIHFIGRETQLNALADAFAAVKQGTGPMIVTVHGRSGVGKSALIGHYLDMLRQSGEAVVLAGRCYERESVPYKALDSAIDALVRYLRRPDSRAERLMPRDVRSLARVFPAFLRVPAVAESPLRPVEVPDQQEARRRAVAALRELLVRLGDYQPVVLWLDDLQWGDTDSARIVAEVMTPPDAPRLLFIACYRRTDSDPGPFLHALQRDSSHGVPSRDLPVEPLSHEEACHLVRALLGPGYEAEPEVEAAARESSGNPFLIGELVQWITAGEAVERGEITIDGLVSARVRRLPESDRRVLEVVSVSGRPIGPVEAWQAAGESGDPMAAVARLRAARLLRNIGTDRERIETFHDRIREAVVGTLGSAVLRAYHRSLAASLDSGDVDPEILAAHWYGAGETDKATEYYARAGDRAASTLAFDRAASLYERALTLIPETEDRRRGLQRKHADSLANAGRGPDAARTYLAAAEGAEPLIAVDLQRRAAMQYLIAGHLDRGLEVLRAVLRSLNLRFPSTQWRTLLSLVFRRLQLRLRGLGFRLRNPAEVPVMDLLRIDTCWSATLGLGIADPFLGAYFQVRGLLLALEAGEPARLCRALALESAYSSMTGRRGQRHTTRHLREAEILAAKTAQPFEQASVALAEGAAAFLNGRWAAALTHCDQADATFRDNCTGVTWERNTARAFALWALAWMGEVGELARRCPILLSDARERNDLYALLNINMFALPLARMAADEPGQARGEVRDAVQRWTQQGFHLQHLVALFDEAKLDLYLGDGRASLRRADETRRAVARSYLSRVQLLRGSIADIRGRAAVIAAGAGADRESLLQIAMEEVRRLEGEDVSWLTALAGPIRAGIATVRGEREAITLWRETAERLDAAGMGLHAAAARWRCGELLDGDAGRSMQSQAATWMSQRAIANPGRMTRMLAPGVRM